MSDPVRPRHDASEAIHPRYRINANDDMLELVPDDEAADSDFVRVSQVKAELDALRQQLAEASAENREIHAMLTGKGEIGWAMTHPDGPTTEAGKALSKLNVQLFEAEAEREVLRNKIAELGRNARV